MKPNSKNDGNEKAGAGPEDNEPAEVGPPHAGDPASKADKNEARKNRRKLAEISKKAGLTSEEIDLLAMAKLQNVDPVRIWSDDDPVSSILAAEETARRRVHRTSLMAGPNDPSEVLSTGKPTIEILSAPYLDTERSLTELTIAMRGARKAKDAAHLLYLEYDALFNELSRQREEKRRVAKELRHNVPEYHLVFARFMETLGFRRNDLRYISGAKVKAICQALGEKDVDQLEAEALAAIFQRWLAESSPEDYIDRCSRMLSAALHDGDLVAIRQAFDAFKLHATTVGDLGESIDITTARNDGLIDNQQHRTTTEREVGSSNPLTDSKPVHNSASTFVDNSASSPSSAPLSPAVSDTKPAENIVPLAMPYGPYRYLTGWGVKMPKDKDYGRVDGWGRLPGGDAFGGVVSMATSTLEVIPMWERTERPRSLGDKMTLDDWYRFEVPAGNYALVHMPRRLLEYVPVTDKMFPPYLELERYGVDAGFSASDMRSLKIASSGRGGMDVAIRAIRSVLIMNYGKDNEDLLRFWVFLLLGRQFMSRIDVLFPHGYFHGLYAPDPAANKAGSGSFCVVRILDDGNLSEQLRRPMFPPFDARSK